MEQHDWDESRTLFEIDAERSPKLFTVFVKRFHSKKHVVLQSTAPLQLKCFKVVSRMAIAASAPLLPNQEKNCVAKSPDSQTHSV
jgi:hypothetical protein